MSHRRIYFVSDVHLGAPGCRRDGREQEDALIAFLRSIREDAETLYLVGDLFNFWFEYRTAVPACGARVLFELYALVQAGVRVVYIPGNHDIWLGPYLSEQVGLELARGPMTIVHQGLTLFVAHGDEFRDDWKFRISRGILKNPCCIALFRLLHPDLGDFLARSTSRLSEYRIRRRPPDKTRKTFIRIAREKVAREVDVVLCGHYHRHTIEQIGSGVLVVLGDWITHDSYAVLENGKIELRKWRG